MTRILLFKPGGGDPENMQLTEKNDFDWYASHGGRRCADLRRQGIRRALAYSYIEANGNIFVGILCPGYWLKAGEDLTVLIGECTTTTCASMRKERTTKLATLFQGC